MLDFHCSKVDVGTLFQGQYFDRPPDGILLLVCKWRRGIICDIVIPPACSGRRWLTSPAASWRTPNPGHDPSTFGE